jgi:hypothetical protein
MDLLAGLTVQKQKSSATSAEEFAPDSPALSRGVQKLLDLISGYC